MIRRPLSLAPLLLLAGACSEAVPLAQATLEHLATAPAHVAIHGVRLHEVETPIGIRSIEDEITTDGQGGIELVLRGWNGLSKEDFVGMGLEGEWDTHVLEYDRRERYTARFRDFAVADTADAVGNYEIEFDANPQSRFGRPAFRTVFTNRHSGRSYELLWDAQTAVVLASVERSGTGAPLSRTQYLEFEILASPQPILDVPLTKIVPPEGFAPRLLPQGYRHVEAWGLDDPAEGLLRVDRYTDGIDHLFVAQRPSATRDAGDGAFVVRHVPLGAVRILEADAQGQTLSVVGRLPVDELLPILGSLSK